MQVKGEAQGSQVLFSFSEGNTQHLDTSRTDLKYRGYVHNFNQNWLIIGEMHPSNRSNRHYTEVLYFIHGQTYMPTV